MIVNLIIIQIRLKSPRVSVCVLINVWKEEYDPEFDTNSVKTAKALHNEYKRIAYEKNTNIISAADYVQPSETDQEHLTAQGHEILANAIFNAVVSASIV